MNIESPKPNKIARATIRPLKHLALLSQREIAELMTSDRKLFRLFRDCALAILNTDSQEDDASRVLSAFSDFDIMVVPQSRGLKLEIFNAPARAFVDGEMMRGIRDHLFSALRDIVYTDLHISGAHLPLPETSEAVTDIVFRVLRNADVVRPDTVPNLVVCWGGHAISREEYDYSKEVGYQCGLRGLDIVTGCGIGAMKGPMKGAAVGHAKQKVLTGRYIGISEPGIIASEPPNPIVNELVIMQDIEKRLEAFVRVAHTIMIFPGGVGTIEELLFLFSILLNPENANSVPVIITGPESAREYFKSLERFIVDCFGPEVQDFYTLVVGDPAEAARQAKLNIQLVHRRRRDHQEAYSFNWNLQLDMRLQQPFVPTHANMSNLVLDASLPPHELAARLRLAFSGIVAGNVKAFGIAEVKKHGPYPIAGDAKVLYAMDQLLREFIMQQRMKLGESGAQYKPCYRLLVE